MVSVSLLTFGGRELTRTRLRHAVQTISGSRAGHRQV